MTTKPHDDFTGPALPIEPRNLDHIITLRLPSELMIRLREYANQTDQTISQVMREQVRRLVLQPVGWHCEHLSMGSAEGALTSVECGAGCDMRREYAS